MVVGDDDFASDLMQFSDSLHNVLFVESALLWLAGREDLLSIRGRTAVEGRLDRIADPAAQRRVVLAAQALNVAAVPLLVLAFGAVRLLRRRQERRMSSARGADSFRARLLRSLLALAALGGLFAAGLLLSPERARERAAGRPLLPPGSTAEVEEIELREGGAVRLTLRRQGEGWIAQAEGLSPGPACPEGRTPGGSPAGAAAGFPADRARVEGLLETLRSLRRGTLASGDPAREAALGLEEGEARQVVLRRGGGPPASRAAGRRPRAGRGRGLPAGEGGGGGLAGARQSLHPPGPGPRLLARPAPAARRRGRGRHRPRPGERGRPRRRLHPGARRGRGLAAGGGGRGAGAGRPRGGGGDGGGAGRAGGGGRGPGAAAAAAPAPAAAAAPPLEAEVDTRDGGRIALKARGGAEPGKALVTVEGSPWTRVVSAAALQRAFRPAAALRGEGR